MYTSWGERLCTCDENEGYPKGDIPSALGLPIGASGILAGKATWFHCVSISEANE